MLVHKKETVESFHESDKKEVYIKNTLGHSYHSRQLMKWGRKINIKVEYQESLIQTLYPLDKISMVLMLIYRSKQP